MNKFILQNIQKSYAQGETTLHVLKDINITLNPGEVTALVGTSGSGKSTLLHIAGLLDHPTGGKVLYNDMNLWELSDQKRTAFRLDHIGFVYQFHHLLPEFTARENIMLPAVLRGMAWDEAAKQAQGLLETLNLGNRHHHRPAQLSGGEQQRVAILRALINKPQVILADEPTGNLDEDTSDRVFEEMLSLVRDYGITALIATHDKSLAQKMDRTLHLKGGVLLSQED